jgi:hypothetical protein
VLQARVIKLRSTIPSVVLSAGTTRVVPGAVCEIWICGGGAEVGKCPTETGRVLEIELLAVDDVVADLLALAEVVRGSSVGCRLVGLQPALHVIFAPAVPLSVGVVVECCVLWYILGLGCCGALDGRRCPGYVFVDVRGCFGAIFHRGGRSDGADVALGGCPFDRRSLLRRSGNRGCKRSGLRTCRGDSLGHCGSRHGFGDNLLRRRCSDGSHMDSPTGASTAISFWLLARLSISRNFGRTGRGRGLVTFLLNDRSRSARAINHACC